MSHGPFCIILRKLGVGELVQENADTLAIAIAVTKSFVSDLRVLSSAGIHET